MGYGVRFAAINLILLLVLSGCSQPPPAIRIGTILWPGYEYLHLAEHLGYFEEEGVRVQLVEFVSLTDSRRAFERGQIDAWGTTAVELLQSVEHPQRNAQAFYLLDYSNGADVILARADRLGIFDLDGRRVAAEPGTLDVVLLTVALKSYGMTLDDVELVPMPQHQIPRAFREGTIDAAVSYPPNAFEILRAGDVRRIFDSSEVPGYVIDVLAADSAFIESHAEELAAIVRAVERAQDYARVHQDAAFAVMAAREGISPEEFAEAMSGIEIVPLASQVTCFEADGRIAQAFGVVRETLQRVGMISPGQADAPPYTVEVIQLAMEP